MANYKGLRVIEVPNSEKKNNVFIGTVIVMESFTKVPDKVVYVQWDNGSVNQYQIGHMNCYELLSYDNAKKGEIHVGFRCQHNIEEDIIGTMWSCLNCLNGFMCTSCCMNMVSHKDHDMCRFDSPNHVGYFVGKLEICDTYRGIVRNSCVVNALELSPPFKGKVDTIEFNCQKKCPIIKVKLTNENMKTFPRYETLKLENDDVKVKIDKNHLRILGHNPVFNCELFQHYKDKLDDFVTEFSNEDINFEIGDTVYIDCFTAQDLGKFQKGFGEYNSTIEKLIGEPGTVTQVDKSVLRVHYHTIGGDIALNRATIFNRKNTKQIIIRISSNLNHLKEMVKNWVGKLGVKASSKLWHPGDSMLERISGRIGVIVMDGLPDDLAVVKFKLHLYSYCILLPKKVCCRLDGLEDMSSTGIQDFINLGHDNLSEDEATLLETGKQEIINKNMKFFENELIYSSCALWTALFHCAVEMKNTDTMRIMVKEPSCQSFVNDYLLQSLLRNKTWTSEIEDIFLDSATLDFNRRTPDGDNLLHLASKNGYCNLLDKVLSRETYNQDINSKNTKSGFTAFHYAAQNDLGNVIRILMEHKCDINATSNQDYTGLHIALQHYYFDALLVVVELIHEDLNVDISDCEGNTILHLAASLPNEDMLKRWNSIIADDKDNELTKLVEALNNFKDIYEDCRAIDVRTTPCVIISCLILNKAKNANMVWSVTFNKQGVTPSKVLLKSIKKDDKTVSNPHLLRLFKLYQNSSGKMEMCQFCKADFAVVLYKPCGHKLYCEHCSLMPDKCGQCRALIERRSIDNIDIKHFEDWNNAATILIDIKCPENMSDWFKLVHKMLQQRQCPCCMMSSITSMLHCGHGICNDCYKKTKVCPTCQTQITERIEMKSFDLKEY